MRILWNFIIEKETSIPIDHQEHLQHLVHEIAGNVLRYGTNTQSSAPNFHFGNLRSQSRVIENGTIRFAPGRVEWQFATPSAPILNEIQRYTEKINRVKICDGTFHISSVKPIEPPDLSSGRMECTCLTPFVTAAIEQPTPGIVRYLRPLHHISEIESVLLNELLVAHNSAYGLPAHASQFRLEFNQNYLRRDHRGGTRKVRFRGEDIIGSYAPFIMYADRELLRTAWECGLGQRRTDGFGMVTMRPTYNIEFRHSAQLKDCVCRE